MHQLLRRAFRSVLAVACLSVCPGVCGHATPIDEDTDLVVVIPDRSTSEVEIATAIQELISSYPVCVRLPALRLVGREIDFDPNSRRHREYEGMEAELDVLTRLGYLTKSTRPDLAGRVVRFDLVERGTDEYGIVRDRLCLKAERKLVSVTEVQHVTEFARHPGDGYLQVYFDHEPDAASVWMLDPDIAKLVSDSRLSSPEPRLGLARLSRVWIRAEHPLKGAPHSGVLWALDYDAIHNRYDGGRWGSIVLNATR